MPETFAATDEAASQTGPFSDLLVIEIGQFVVAPVCSQYLADGGARVIKVEPPTGDPYRTQDPVATMESRQFAIKNRGKESLPLKLGHPGAAEVLERLIARADILIVNARPDTLARHGLAYADVAELNPRLIYAAASAFGFVGREARFGGMDVVAQARSGLLYAAGAEEDGLPYHSEVQFADFSSALLMLAGIGAALHSRSRTGLGQEVGVSLIGGALALQGNVLGHFVDHDAWREEFVNDVLPRARAEKWTPREIASARRDLRPDPRDTTYYRVFRTSDGMLAVGAGSPTIRASLFDVLGLHQDGGTVTREAVDRAFEQRSSDELVELLRGRGVPVSEVRHVEELFFDEHVRDEGLVRDVEHPTLGKYATIGAPIRMGATPFVGDRPSPLFGEHAVDILTELGFEPTEIDALFEGGAVVTLDRQSGEDRA